MSDSESENSNLSELEEEDAVSIEGDNEKDEDKEEANEVLNEIDQTDVKWKDLVCSIAKHMFLFLNFLIL